MDEEICEMFSVYRSLRRSSTTREIIQEASHADIGAMNLWHTVEAFKRKKPPRDMSQHHAKINLLNEQFLRHNGEM